MNPVGMSPHTVREIPESVEMEAGDAAIGDCGVPLEKRDEYAIEIAEKMVLRKYKTIVWDPVIEITEKQRLYKAIYIQRGESQTYLYDTYSGKKTLVENPLYLPKNQDPSFQGP